MKKLKLNPKQLHLINGIVIGIMIAISLFVIVGFTVLFLIEPSSCRRDLLDQRESHLHLFRRRCGRSDGSGLRLFDPPRYKTQGLQRISNPQIRGFQKRAQRESEPHP